MAEFSCLGLDEVLKDLTAVSEIPDDVMDEMLNAGADVVVTAQKRKIRQYRIYDTGQVQRSIKKGKVKIKDGKRVIFVSPTGSRKRGNTVTKNADILFVNEFGKRGKKARPAIRDANEESAEATTAAEAAVLDKWMKSKNL